MWRQNHTTTNQWGSAGSLVVRPGSVKSWRPNNKIKTVNWSLRQEKWWKKYRKKTKIKWWIILARYFGLQHKPSFFFYRPRWRLSCKPKYRASIIHQLYFCFLSTVFLSLLVPWESVYCFNFKIWCRITSLQLIKPALFFPRVLLASHLPSLAWKTRENNACSAGYRITCDITVEPRYSDGPRASLVYPIDLLLTSALWKLALIAAPLGPADRVPTHTYKGKTE